MRLILLMMTTGAMSCTTVSDAAFCGPDFTGVIADLADALPALPAEYDDVGRKGTTVIVAHDAGCS